MSGSINPNMGGSIRAVTDTFGNNVVNASRIPIHLCRATAIIPIG